MKDKKRADRSSLGFIGTGQMGSAMVIRLLKTGYSILAYDINKNNLNKVIKKGAVAGRDVPDVVSQCRMILLSLRSSEISLSVAEKEILPYIRRGQIILDKGTTIAEGTRKMAKKFSRKGAELLDSPVSGGQYGAETGGLFIFCGGTKIAFQKCRPILKALSNPPHPVYCGPSGSGQVMKAVNQLAMGLVDAAYMEAAAFGVRAGLGLQTIQKAVGGNNEWRKHISHIVEQIRKGRGDDLYIKYPEFPYFFDEARRSKFTAPIMTALYEFCKSSTRIFKDNMNRPRPSFWYELMKRKK